MRATLVRETSDDRGTFGRIRLEGTQFAFCTAELPWRNNEPGLSCTKAGTYKLNLVDSQHFHRRLWHLEDRDGRVAEEIHNGNWAGDVEKGYKSDVKGCILLGESIGDVLRPDKQFQKGVAASHAALDKFMELTKDQDLELVIQWKGINPEEENGTQPSLDAHRSA